MTYTAEKHCCTICDAKKICHICHEQTLWACADCQINLSATVYVCTKSSCRDEHEKVCGERLLEHRDALQAKYGADYERVTRDLADQIVALRADLRDSNQLAADNFERAKKAEDQRDTLLQELASFHTLTEELYEQRNSEILAASQTIKTLTDDNQQYDDENALLRAQRDALLAAARHVDENWGEVDPEIRMELRTAIREAGG